MTPLGLLYIGGSLIDDGHNVRLIDASKKDLSNYDIESIIERERPDAVCSGASASTVTHKRSLEILRLAKKIDPKIVMIRSWHIMGMWIIL
jgi:anaerobic magnesium-protoporphyrin IX monomethyl ester cyclase